MPKRKRSDGGILEPGSKMFSQQKRLDEKIFHGRKIVHRALKVAKGFERQKLGRRQKAASQQESDAEQSRITREIEALKDLDLSSCAESHLYRSLLKQKDIASSPVLPKYISAQPLSWQDTATSNVCARLYNSNPVKQAMKSLMAVVHDVMELEVRPRKDAQPETLAQPADKKQSGPPKQPASNEARTQTEVHRSSASAEESDRPQPSALASRIHSSRSQASDRGTSPGEQDSFSNLDDRLASSSDEEDIFNDMEHTHETWPANTLTADPERSTSDFGSSSTGEVAPAAEGRSKTSFMPSLTMGGYTAGYASGSESEPEQDVEQLTGRRNRRGQRARQAIWEKRFGKGANHIKKENTRPEGRTAHARRDQGWDLKRGAQAESQTWRGTYTPKWRQDRESRGKTGQDAASGGNSLKLGTRRAHNDAKAQASKPLHPSWEAAKKAKEGQPQIRAYSGKKMVFDREIGC